MRKDAGGRARKAIAHHSALLSRARSSASIAKHSANLRQAKRSLKTANKAKESRAMVSRFQREAGGLNRGSAASRVLTARNTANARR